MNNSSAPLVYSITSSDTITLSSSAIDAVSIDTSTMANISVASGGLGNVHIGGQFYTLHGGSPSISTISTNSIGPITIDNIGTYSSFHVPEEWDGRFPDWGRIQSMCEQYPGLQIAYEKFKTTYLLVKNHYDTPEDQRPLP
jgi:hypothetical protein